MQCLLFALVSLAISIPIRQDPSVRRKSSLRANAYTTGSDVHFRPTYEPGNSLLAHELTHVVQQRGTHHGKKSKYHQDNEEFYGIVDDEIEDFEK